MEGNKLSIDRQRNLATFPLSYDEVSVIIVHKGEAHCFELDDFSELQVKVNEGRVRLVTVTEKHKI